VELRIDKTRHLAVRWAIMPVENAPLNELESAIASFRASGSFATSGEVLLLPNWRDEDWKQLFRFTKTRRVKAGDALIRHGEPDRTLYFVLHGGLEVIVHSGDGLTLGRVGLAGAGSVLGELAFFDSGPRSAGAWAVNDCEVAAMTPEQYAAFEESSPTLARQLLFALGRILAIRLRSTNARVVG
jgi:CRP/FNR family cyclic AMP-dependent transcriptional regulator